ncbi:MAG: L,D-transpeptidase [Porphyromonas sp.]|nr:L,D-transpeptidase [Porphyromonas sp.]
MKKKIKSSIPFLFSFALVTSLLVSCQRKQSSDTGQASLRQTVQADLPPRVEIDSSEISLPGEVASDERPQGETQMQLCAQDIRLQRKLLYDHYTLQDTYAYGDSTRTLQWETIKEHLARIENMQLSHPKWVVMQNYKNMNREAPTVPNYRRNEYGRVADTLGVERFQSVPLYLPQDSVQPTLYGRDGSIAKYVETNGGYYLVDPLMVEGQWLVPRRYVKELPDTTFFGHVVVVDRNYQNIVTLERERRGSWLIRSANPATTGQAKPPYAQKTPLGVFLIQQKKKRMYYLHDGGSEVAGYAPFASRFTSGAYIHGVPVPDPKGAIIEYSPSLGTTPRSHMCVRNASSHAEFVYNWAPTEKTLVIVIE